MRVPAGRCDAGEYEAIYEKVCRRKAIGMILIKQKQMLNGEKGMA